MTPSSGNVVDVILKPVITIVGFTVLCQVIPAMLFLSTAQEMGVSRTVFIALSSVPCVSAAGLVFFTFLVRIDWMWSKPEGVPPPQVAENRVPPAPPAPPTLAPQALEGIL